MNEELKQILKYLKKKENTRRIKVITITEAEELYRYIVNTEDSLDFNLRSIDKEIEENRKLEERIDKAINILELSSQNKGICTQIGTDTIQSALSILKGEDKE